MLAQIENAACNRQSADMAKGELTGRINYVHVAIDLAVMKLGGKVTGQKALCAELGVARTTLYSWKKKSTMRSIEYDKVERLSKLSGIPIELLTAKE